MASLRASLRSLLQPYIRSTLPTLTPSLPRFSSSSSSSRSPSKDPSHPYLYYHHLPTSSNLISLSYSATPPKSSGSVGVIGNLPNTEEASLGDFRENGNFKKFLHQSIARALQDDKASLSISTLAKAQTSDGYMHIHDERKLPPAGRIPDPEDILGSVYVRDGTMDPSTYEPQPMHRLVTVDGVTVLPRGVEEFVVAEMEKAGEDESA